MRPAILLPRHQAQVPVRHGHRLVGRDHVRVVGLDPHVILGGDHRNVCCAPQYLGQRAVVQRIEMLHEQVCQTGIRRQVLYEPFERVESASGGANAHHRWR